MPEEDLPQANSPTAQAAITHTSMEEIIASISRIIAEENRASRAAAIPPADQTRILELTEMIEPDGTIKKLPPAGRPAEADREPAPPCAGRERVASPGDAASEPAREGILSAPASEMTAAAFGRLAAVVRERQAGPDLALGGGGRTLEDLVRDALRPLLRAWLDEHLPAIVERLVREEIQRVVRAAGSG